MALISIRLRHQLAISFSCRVLKASACSLCNSNRVMKLSDHASSKDGKVRVHFHGHSPNLMFQFTNHARTKSSDGKKRCPPNSPLTTGSGFADLNFGSEAGKTPCLANANGSDGPARTRAHSRACGSGTRVTSSNTSGEEAKVEGPSLRDFIAENLKQGQEILTGGECRPVPYLSDADAAAVQNGQARKVYFETYGCQMNVSDTEIAWSILEKSGFQKVTEVSEADVILAVTCAIRENAEQKIWNRLKFFQSLKNARRKGQVPLKVGLLGCMAERLKRKLLEESKTVDIVAGPDAYRDLPRLLSVAGSGQTAINVMLSMDETYADVIPVRLDKESKSAFVSIMRGCDNMCSYCIVPFTRGRERSRPISSIVEEIRALSDQGVKEVTLLGQNVNSYRDVSESTYYGNKGDEAEGEPTPLARGFKTIYRAKKGGRRFADLLEQVAVVDPEMRIRFTSPHPKDFPDEVLHAIRDFPNICNQLHLPAQSGSTRVLHSMRRGYSREAYLDLVRHVQAVIPGVALSSDFIAGFCGEEECDHEDTMSLLRTVRYNYAFLFAYSMRNKTHAYHRMKDDVPEEVKQRRLREMIAVCRDGMAAVNAPQVGSTQLVLVEGVSKRSSKDMVGRSDANTKVVIPNVAILNSDDGQVQGSSKISAGDYVAVKITESNSQVFKGVPLHHTTLTRFSSATSRIHQRLQVQ